MFFDVRAAKQLKPGEHLNIEGCPGLRLVATATTRTWTYRYKAPGTQLMKQVALGKYPAVSVQDAASEWQRLRDQRDTGADPGRAKREAIAATIAPPSDGYLVRHLVEDFLVKRIEVDRKPVGAAVARRALERLLEEEPAFADTPVPDVSRATAFDVLDSRRGTPTVTQKLRSMLGSAWTLAHDSGQLAETVPNWWPTLLKGRLKSKGKVIGGKHVGQSRRSLRDEELQLLLGWMDAMRVIARDIFVLYLWTGTRGSEISGMRPEHVRKEKDGWWWTIPKEATKNARFADAMDLRVPLIGRALEIVRRRIAVVDESGWVFDDGRGSPFKQARFSNYIYDLQPYSPKSVRHQGRGLVVPVGNWTPHNLRRTTRTLLAALGCPGEVAEAVIGHMPKDIEGVYNAYSYDWERRLWLGKVSDHLETLAQAGAPRRP